MKIDPKDLDKPLRILSGNTDGGVREALRGFAASRLTGNVSFPSAISQIADKGKAITVETVQLHKGNLSSKPADDEVDTGLAGLSLEQVYIVNDGELQLHSIAGSYISTIPVV